MQRASRYLPFLWLSGPALAGFLVHMSGCGASYQVVYDGEVYFERCNRLDGDPGASNDSRLNCWMEWSRSHTFGQTRDRLEYALRRQRELSDKANSSNTRSDAGTANLASPQPTSATESPPAVTPSASTNVTDAGPPPAPPLAHWLTSPEAPAAPRCVAACLQSIHTCHSACPSNAPRCRPACERAFQGCTQACVAR